MVRRWKVASCAVNGLDGFSNAFFSPLAAVVLDGCGVGPKQGGIILSASYLLSAVASVGWTHIADVTETHGLVLRATLWATVVPTVLLFLAVALCDLEENRNMTATATTASWPGGAWWVPLEHLAWLNLNSFRGYFVLICLGALFRAPLGSIVNASLLAWLGDSFAEHYGRYRLWVSVGRAVGAAGSGLALQHAGPAAVLLCAAASHVLLAATSMVYPVMPPPAPPTNEGATPSKTTAAATGASLEATQSAQQQQQQQQHRRKSSWASLWDRQFATFTFTTAVNGIAGATFDTYVVLFLQKELDASGLLLGLSTAVATVACVVCFYVSGKVLRLAGPHAMIVVAMLINVLRCYLYTLLTAAAVWWVLPIQALHGISWVRGRKTLPLSNRKSARGPLGDLSVR